MAKISKSTVDSAIPKGKRYHVWDSQLIGFGLLILPSGGKSFVYQYRTPEGRTRRLTLGKYGDWTPDLARTEAERARDQVKAGVDPLDAKKERIEAPTVNDILGKYLESEKFKAKAASTQAIDRGRIARHLMPTLGKRFVKELTPEAIKRALADIRSGKTAADIKTGKRGRARVTGGDGTARMAIELLRAVFTWAVSENLAGANPCQHVKTGVSGTRETIIEDQEAYARLFRTLETMERERRMRAPVADAIRLIALTGMRRGEAAGLLWSHVDLRRGLLTLPPMAHKSGRKTGKPRIIGLPAAAQAIIARQPEGAPDGFVFQPAQGQGALSLSKPWRAVRVEAALPWGIGLHGLRHSLASHMAMAGAEAAEIMTALGHRQLSTAQKYVHWVRDARQALAERAAAVALSGMTAAAGAPVAEVAPMKR